SDGSRLALNKFVHFGMTPSMMALAFALEFNRGYNALWASVSGSVLTLTSRTMGLDGNDIYLDASPTTGAFTAIASAWSLAGGGDGDWRVDQTASPRLNRAVRDWSASFFAALEGYGIDTAAAFSMELGNPQEPLVGIELAQKGPAGDDIVLPTP